MYRLLLVITALAASASVNDTQKQTSQPTTISSNDTQKIPSETNTTFSNETQNMISDLKGYLQKVSNDTHLLVSDVRKNLAQIDKSEQLTFDRFMSNNIRLKSSLTSALANINDMRSKHARLEQQYEALRKSYVRLQNNYYTVQQKIENDSNMLQSIYDKSASIEQNISRQIMASNEVLQINNVTKTKIVEIQKDIPMFNIIFINSLNNVAYELKKKVTEMAVVHSLKLHLLVALKVRIDDRVSVKLHDLRKGFSLECPKGWEKIDNTCYKVQTSLENLTPNMAAKKCEQENGTPATIRSKTVEEYIDKKMSTNWVWVGGRYMPSQSGDIWAWHDGTPIDAPNYINWGFGVPVQSKDPGRCMYYWDRGWFNRKCDEKPYMSYACEKVVQLMLH